MLDDDKDRADRLGAKETVSGQRRDELLKLLGAQDLRFERSVEEYATKYKHAKNYALAAKSIAVFGLAVGVVLPALSGISENDALGWEPYAVAFAALIIAGLAAGLDQTLMLTANRLGFLKALSEMSFLRANFALDIHRFGWMARTDAEAESCSDDVFRSIREAEAARLAVIRQETEAWQAAYRDSVKDLQNRIHSATQRVRTTLSERDAKADADEKASRPGTATIEVKSPQNANSVIVKLHGDQRPLDPGADKVAFTGLPTGPHVLGVTWRVGESAHSREEIIQVKPDQNTELILDLAAE